MSAERIVWGSDTDQYIHLRKLRNFGWWCWSSTHLRAQQQDDLRVTLGAGPATWTGLHRCEKTGSHRKVNPREDSCFDIEGSSSRNAAWPSHVDLILLESAGTPKVGFTIGMAEGSDVSPLPATAL